MKNTRIKISTVLVIAFFIVTQCSIKNDKPTTRQPAEAQIDTSLLITSAELYYDNNLYSEAALEYKKLLTYDSTNGKFYFRRAYSLLQIDSFTASIENYSKAAKFKFEEADCYFAIGSIYSRGSNDSLTVLYLEKALQLNPNMEKAKTMLSAFKKQKERTVL